MVCFKFNVSLYVNAISFFSTELANAGKCSLSVLSLTGHIVLTLFHQGVHHLVQFGKVFRIGDCQDRRLVIWNLPCACFYQISDFSSFAMGSDFGSSCADLVSSSLSSFSPKKNLQLQLLSKSKERLQIFLTKICFSVIEKVNNGRQVLREHSPHVNQGICVFVALKQAFKEGTGCCQDHFVNFYLMPIFTGQGDISEVRIFPETSKGRVDMPLEIVPPQT